MKDFYFDGLSLALDVSQKIPICLVLAASRLSVSIFFPCLYWRLNFSYCVFIYRHRHTYIKNKAPPASR